MDPLARTFRFNSLERGGGRLVGMVAKRWHAVWRGEKGVFLTMFMPTVIMTAVTIRPNFFRIDPPRDA